MLTSFAETYSRHWAGGMAAKLGLPAPDPVLATDLQELLRTQHVDFTMFFRSLAAGTARSLFDEPEPFDAWATCRDALLPADRAAVAAAMNRVNPIYIPRNHLVEEALTAATAGDLARSAGSWSRLRSGEQRPGLDDYAAGARRLRPVRHVLRNLTGRARRAESAWWGRRWVSTSRPPRSRPCGRGRPVAPEPSAERMVQPSGSKTIRSVVRANQGSSARVIPARSVRPRPARPLLGTWGSSCIVRPSPWPPTSVLIG